MSHGEEKHGGVHIIPKARPSIHHHNHCPFSSIEDMGRYGLETSQDKRAGTRNSPSNNDDGVDEVDNIMSKLAKPSSPLLMKRKNAPRRNSLNPEEGQETEDDSDKSDMLAKSLPATLPSYSSGEFGYWSINSDKDNNYGHDTSAGHRTPQLNRIRFSDRNSPAHTPNLHEEVKRENKKSSGYIMPLIGLISVATALCSVILKPSQAINNVVYDELEFYTDLSDLGRKYKLDDDSILRVQTGISTIYKRQDTGSFIFVYNSKMKDFDPVQFNNFMDDIAKTAARYLRNDSTTVQHFVLNSADLDMQSHSDLIHRHKDDVDKAGVMLVRELDKVPSDLAMAFHYYCDEYNPLVKKSAIFFTLNLARCEMRESKSILAHIEKCLKQKWNGGIPHDNIGPLLTRVVTSVIDVTSI